MSSTCNRLDFQTHGSQPTLKLPMDRFGFLTGCQLQGEQVELETKRFQVQDLREIGDRVRGMYVNASCALI